MLILVSCNSNVQDDITPESSPKSEQTEFEHDAILEKNQKFCEENEKLKNNRLNYSPDTFYPELNELTGVYYHNETDTTICIEMLTAPGARAISEYFVTIQTKTDEGNDIVFQDVPAYSASVTEYDGCLMVSLGSCYSTYTGTLLLEYEKHDQIYYTLRSDIDGCVDTGDSIVSVENVTQAADLPQYKNYILDEATARSLIYDYYPDKQISDMARYMSPQETEEAMNILYENQWYKNDTNEKWSLHESLIHYEIIAAYNLDDMAYSIYYYDRYAPGALCCASIPLQYGDPWRPIDIYIPDSTGTLIYNSYLSMSHDEIEQYKVEEGYDVFEPDFDLREFIDNLFTEYEDISEYEVLSVGQFYNGIAYFVLDDVTYTGTWQGTEYINGKYGYVNTEGKVIVPPNLYTSSNEW